MSLIDRVAQRYTQSGMLKGRIIDPETGRTLPRERVEAVKPAQRPTQRAATPPPAPAAPERRTEPHAASNARSHEFALDFAKLRAGGYITPFNRKSKISEEMRLIKRRLMQRMSGASDDGGKGREHVILVTSSRPGEGKSFTAVNLALSIVLDEGFNVLLVDADVARPSLRRLFGTEVSAGLTDLLREDPPDMSEVLQRERNHPLTFLSAGNAVASATDLFASTKMQTLVDDIADRYTDRIIIFDAPPLLASTEPVALAQHVGQIVFVVDASTTSRSAVESALDLLDSRDSVSLVLNRSTISGSLEQFGSYYDAYNRGVER